MKKTRKWGALLLITGLTTFVLFGCQSSDTPNKDKTDTSSTSTSDPVETTAPADNTATTDETDTDSETHPDAGDVEQTNPADISGEGSTDNVLPDLSTLDKAPLKQPCVITGDSGIERYTLTVNSISSSDERNEGDSTADDQQLVIIDYSYENTANTDPLLLDDLYFKLLDGDTLCTPYYLSTLTAPELAATGETVSGQIAFLVAQDCTEVTLYFEDPSDGATAAFTSTL